MVAAPVIEAEMADWTALGGGNSGICGDPNHTYGFHLTANQTSPDDYSRWRDPNGSDGPYVDWNYCCAGDFSHRNDERLRAMHRSVLARLMRGELPMICEFIGQPWADQPVYYWARWNGVTTLRRYTGAGHDHWSHVSWYRSMADQRAYLWTKEDDMAKVIRTTGKAGEILFLDALGHGICVIPPPPAGLRGTYWPLQNKLDAFAMAGVEVVDARAAKGWPGGYDPEDPGTQVWLGVPVKPEGSVELSDEDLQRIEAAAREGAQEAAPTKAELEQAAFEGAQRAERQ